MKETHKSVIVSLQEQTIIERKCESLMTTTVTQDAKYRQSLLLYAKKYGVSRASRKYNKTRSYIYFWKARYDGTLESLTNRSKRPHSHPNQHTQQECELILKMRRRNPNIGLIDLWSRLLDRGYTRRPESLYRVLKRMGEFPQTKKKSRPKPKPYEQMTHPGERVQIDVKVVPRACCIGGQRLYQYTAIDEFSRMRYLGAYEEQSTYSSADFLKRVVAYFKHLGVIVECVQTDNGAEFTKRLLPTERRTPTLFEARLKQYGIEHKLIRPYTPRHNGKVERSHRKDNEYFYATHTFYSFDDFKKQLAVHSRKYNNFPMRPLNWKAPADYIKAFMVNGEVF